MKKIILIFFGLTCIFFWSFFIKGWVPFPGDLLVGNYVPYNTYPFLGYAPGGYPNKAQDFDVLELLYPAKEFAIGMLKGGEFPLWNPYNFSGNPHLASLQAGTFYPLNILFFFLPFISAWSIYIFIQPFLTGIFTFLFLREARLNFKSSILGGLTFAFSSYLVVWMEYGNIGHSILWLPLAMWLFLKILQKPSIKTKLLLLLILTFSLLAGYIQTTFYLFLFFFSFLVFKTRDHDRKKWLKGFLGFSPLFILPLFLSAIQLLPTIELLNQSARSAYSTANFFQLLIPPFHLVTLLIPDFFGNPATRNYWLVGTYIERVFYIGIIPLFFALYGLMTKRTTLTWFFTGSLLVVLLLTIDSVFSRMIYSLNIPLIKTAVPTRMMFLFCFSASFLAAYGFDCFDKERTLKPFIKTALILSAIFIFLWIFVFIVPLLFPNLPWIKNLAISKRNLLLPSGIFFLTVLITLSSFGFTPVRKYFSMMIIILTVFDLFYFFQKITPFAPKETVYPQTEVLKYLKNIQGINRYWGYGSGYMEANLQTHEKMFSTDGYDALHLMRYGEIISASKDGKIAQFVPGSEADLASGYGTDELRNNLYRQKILNLLGVKYLLNKISPSNTSKTPDYQTFPAERYALIYQSGSWQIYENKEALPRVFLAANYIVESKSEEIIKKIFDDKFNLRQTIILEEDLRPEFKPENDADANVLVLDYNPNKITIKTEADTDMLLFLSDNYFPGWHVRIDGVNGKIYRADYSFRAVAIPRGSHEVLFWYYPDSFDLGLKISILTFLGITIFFIYKTKKREN